VLLQYLERTEVAGRFHEMAVTWSNRLTISAVHLIDFVNSITYIVSSSQKN